MAKVKVEFDSSDFNKVIALSNRWYEMNQKNQQIWDQISNRINALGKNMSLFGKTWSWIKSDWADLAFKIESITRNIFGWRGVLRIFKGLLGGGGLFGLEGLAASVTERRRQALGFGGDYGKIASFLTNFQRLVDAQQILSRVSTAKYDITSMERVGLQSMGFGPKEFEKDPSEITKDVLNRLPEMLKGIPENQWLPTAHALRIPLSDQDILRRMKTDSETWNRIQGLDKKYERDMNLSKKEQSAWVLLNTQLDIAGRRIETAFQRSLISLAQSSGDLSEVISNKLIGLINSKGFKVIIDFISSKLEEFKDWLGGPNFKKDVEMFASGVSSFLKDMKSIFDFFAWIAKKFGFGGEEDTTGQGGQAGGRYGPIGGGPYGGGGGGAIDIGKVGKLPSGDLYKKFMQVAIDEGATPKEAAALAGQATAESRLGTMYGGKVLGVGTGDYGAASGMIQWHKDRWNKVVEWARSKGLDPAQWESQVRMGVHELLTDKRYDAVRRAIAAAKTPLELERASAAFEGYAGWQTHPRASAIAGTRKALEENYQYGTDINIDRGHKLRIKRDNMNEPAPQPQSMNEQNSRIVRNVNNTTMWQGRSQFALNIFNKSGSNAIIEASRLGLGPA